MAGVTVNRERTRLLNWRNSARSAKAFAGPLLLAILCTRTFHGQAMPAGEKRMDFGVIVEGSIVNSQLPYFADNAAGFNVGLFAKVTPSLGLEMRAGAYPYKATFEQAPVTAGVTISRTHVRDIQTAPFAYFGGGLSHAQYSKANYRPSVSLWTPCWQMTSGTDLDVGRFTWRMYELSWTETYAIRQNIRSLGISTGIVYSFHR